MDETVRMGTVAGVRVGLHWSVLGIVALVSVGLAGYHLPQAYPGHSQLGYVLGGVVAAVLLVASLLAHEVAHAVVARRNGVAVEGITLWLLGGVARLRGEARTPGIELRIAVVGPATSLVLAAVFGFAAWVAYRFAGSGLGTAVLGYLALLNLVLAVFNMVPAAPLDGGRVLRAVLWRWTGDQYEAAVWAARSGRGLGFLLLTLGFVELLARGPGGVWWVLLGWFIVSIASAEEQQAKVSKALAGVRVRDVMSSPVESAEGHLTVERFLHEVALQRPHATFPLLDETGRFGGLVTLRQLRLLPLEARRSTTVVEVACPADRVSTAGPEEPLAAVLPRLSTAEGGRLVVLRSEEVIGIVSPSDVSRVVAEHGLLFGAPGGADLSMRGDESAPPDWWYPGQRERE